MEFSDSWDFSTVPADKWTDILKHAPPKAIASAWAAYRASKREHKITNDSEAARKNREAVRRWRAKKKHAVEVKVKGHSA
jgi:hypothetical protein